MSLAGTALGVRLSGREWVTVVALLLVGLWRLVIVRAVTLVYLLFVIGAIRQDSPGASAVWAYVILAAFAICWLIIPMSFPGADLLAPVNARRFWILYAILIALFVAEVPLARSGGFVLGIYIAITSVGYLGARAAPIVLALALAALLVPVAIPPWHQTIGDTWGDVTPIGIPIAGITVFIMLQVLRSTRQLAEARADVARLAAENERIRIARDLHDLLGHSLTTITVKAGLAARLGEAHHERALQEIAEVETLARQTLSEMRAAVVRYREVSLAGELATGRELLRAAGIAADLPHAVDVVDPAHQELFGWVVREGLTNVVRHARAKTCVVRLSAGEVEIVDDGVGGAAVPGNGLTGLRERVAEAGGVVAAGPLQPAGWRLWVALSAAGDAP